jgi:small subunit ribosomal protein S16
VTVKLRLMRMGKKKQPTYRIVASDSRSPRDGRFIEIVGTYAPRSEPSVVEVDNARAVRWLSQGAQPTDTVRKLLAISGAWTEFESQKGRPHAAALAARQAPAPKPVPKPAGKAPAAKPAAADTVKAEEVKAEEVKAEEVKAEEVKAEEVKTVEAEMVEQAVEIGADLTQELVEAATEAAEAAGKGQVAEAEAAAPAGDGES